MVKIEKPVLNKNLIDRRKQMNDQLVNQLSHLCENNLSDFIRALVDYEKLNSAHKSIKDAYVILATCFYVQEQSPFKTFTGELKEKCKKTIKKIIQYHAEQSQPNKTCFGFKLTQSILNTTSAIIIPYITSN